MRRIVVAVATSVAVLLPLAAVPATAQEPPATPADEQIKAYTAEVDEATLDATVQELNEQDVDYLVAEEGEVEIFATQPQAEALEQEFQLQLELQAAEQEPERVFRPWSGPGGLEEELRAFAAQNRDLVKVVVLGQSIQGQDILAFKVTQNANRVADGRRPASLYSATQHAREWITPEMARRLLRYMVDGYGSNPEIRRLLDRNELWFIPMANPDGYDRTFTQGNRLWRKNVRDNDGNGVINNQDGVDLNRNFPYKWGYDNEGSSPVFSSGTYRGTGPESEPETQAMLELYERVDFSFHVNYHSAAELNLYGVGWQVNTPSPDDIVAIALAGTDDNPAVPGYDPDLSAELYTTNGETTNHVHAVEGTVAFTPEMATCQSASARFPDDPWEPSACQSGFNFPDDERLVQDEFERNLPFALSIARSSADPDDPESAVGIDPPDFVVDTFEVSYGNPQTVQVTAKRGFGPLLMEYRINGGRRLIVPTREWHGGERYGAEFDVHYAKFRGVVRGTRPGDEVEVTFRRGFRRAEPFTYRVADDSGDRVLIVANEDYDGFNPVQDADGPKYVDTYAAALAANGIASDVWDVDAQGAPHPLGVLSHYRAVVWETGDNRITQNEEDTNVLGNPDLGVADVQQFTTIAMRDFLNEGGRIFYTGEYSGYLGPNGILYYADDDEPDQPCTVESDDCLFISNDTFQYYFGLWLRQSVGTPGDVIGTGDPLTGLTIPISGGDVVDNQDDAGGFLVTSSVLPPSQFPLFTSAEIADYTRTQTPFQPIEGSWYAGIRHANNAYERLGRTFAVPGDADSAELSFQLSYSTEFDYDHVVVEARPVGTEEWTTLPDLNGGTTQNPGSACREGLYGPHPQINAYLTRDPATGACTPTGTTGEWNAFTGNSEGWQQVRVDLSRYAGQEVEVTIAYITDPGTGGTGVFVDDTRFTVNGAEVEANGFEESLAPWTPSVAPGSPNPAIVWSRSQSLVAPIDLAAAVRTEDTVTFGFGFEAIATEAQRNDVMGRVMRYLLR